MSTAEAAAPAPSTGYSHRQIMVIMSGLMLALLLASLDQTIVSTALTTISKDFHRPDLYSWVVTAYLLTSTASTPLYGKISDIVGRKTIFQIAIVIFLIGSALSGLSQNMYELIAFRAVQGVGAGGLISLAMAIVGDVIPPRERGRYQGYFGAVFGVSTVLGPLVGGFLVDQASWRWVFYVNVPIGIVALIVVNRVLRLDHHARRVPIDVAGALLLVSGMSLFLVGVQKVGQDARVTGTSLALGGVGLVLLAVFVWWEGRAAEPILPLRLFRNSVFRVANTLALITGAVMFGAIIFLPQYLQTVRGVSPTVSGLRLLPLMAGLLLTSIVSGRLITRTGRYKGYVVAGTAILTLGTLWLTRIDIHTGAWLLSAIIFVVGIGLGLFMQTLVLAVQNSARAEDMGVASSSVTMFRTLGGAIGSSVLGAILIAQERSHLAADVLRYGPHEGPLYAFTHGMTDAYLWAVPVAAAAFLLSFRLRDIRLRDATARVTEARVAEAESAALEAGAPMTPPGE